MISIVQKHVISQNEINEIASAKRELGNAERDRYQLSVRIRVLRDYLMISGQPIIVNDPILDEEEKKSFVPRDMPSLEDLDELDVAFLDILSSGHPKGLKAVVLVERLVAANHPVTQTAVPKKAVMEYLNKLIKDGYAYRTGPGYYRTRREFREARLKEVENISNNDNFDTAPVVLITEKENETPIPANPQDNGNILMANVDTTYQIEKTLSGKN